MKYLKEYIDGTFRVKSFPNSNVIRFNYNQGVLLVEGSYAHIIANKIDGNIKANIAAGGENSGKTKIKFNQIEHSKSEGVFLVEAHESLLVEENTINNNLFGGRKRHNAQTLSLIEELKYDISYSTMKLLVNFDNEAVLCYDKIIANVSRNIT